MFNRIVTADAFKAHTCFLWGPRQSGKSTLLRRLFPRAPYYDLLRAAEFRRLHADPGLLRQEVDALGWTRASQPQPIVVDEIQKLPELLDEIHDIVSRTGLRFVLTGSSPRKILRGGGNLLGGRAVRRRLFPLVSAEIDDFDLERALAHGLLPPHYLAPEPAELLTAYVGNYLRDEIMAEGVARNLPAFQRFLEVAALGNGQVVNFTNIARELGIAANTVRAWFELLVDTLVGDWVPAWQKRAKRRVVESPRFWFFDVGLMNELTRRGPLRAGTPAFGEAFEHFVFMELRAHASYRALDRPICYWRTTSGFEVDFVLGDAEFAIEVKSTDAPSAQHMRGLRAFGEEHPRCHRLLVCRVNRARRTEDGIDVLPVATFLQRLWKGEYGGD